METQDIFVEMVGGRAVLHHHSHVDDALRDALVSKKLSEITLGEIVDELGKVADKFLNRMALLVFGYLVVIWLVKRLGWMH